MSLRLHPLELLDHALTEAGPLARELLNVVQDELDRQSQHFALREGWRKVRANFAADFEGRLIELLQAGRRGEDPLHRAPQTLGGLESLSLVDERQALQDVAIAHVAHTAEEASRAELHQIGNFYAALRGTARARDRDNPLRPAVYAHALHHALAASPLSAQAQYELMRVAATPLARALNRLYGQFCATLRAADISDMVASHGYAQSDPHAHQRLAAARGVGARASTPGTLDGLSRRVDAFNSRPQGLGAAPRDPLAPAPFVRSTGPDMLSRLYDQILADPRLLPPLKALLARLQIAVVRLARADATLLRRQDHPTWALLNRVAAHGMAFGRADDPRFLDFLHAMEAEAQLLVDAPTPTAGLFQQVLARVDAHIDAQARQSSERNALALAALEREQQRSEWRELVREQIDQQIAEAPLGPRMHRFLQTAWVDVIVTAMIRHGRDSREAESAAEMVDAILDSLNTPRDASDREALRMRLPVLIERFVAGCDSVRVSEAKREAALAELMAQHSRLLSGLPALEAATRPPAAAPAAAGAEAPATADAIVKRLLEERDSQVPSLWLSADVDRGELPTVPTQLYNEHDSPDARAALRRWIDGLEIGRWFHLFIQGDWHTAQIAWISEGRQFLLFVGREADERLPLTRRALEALLANGLITALEEDSVVQRAVDTLLSDLDGG